jgi:F420-0:gamma-glutamyl ligase-like protein
MKSSSNLLSNNKELDDRSLNTYNSQNIYNEQYMAIPIKTNYIKPEESYDVIIQRASKLLNNGDFLVISETPIAISQGRLVDEMDYKPSIISILITELWSKYLWGYILGPILKIKRRTIKNLRKLPKEARYHKQFILEYYGIKHALKPASEAGVDLSNVPGTQVCLLPEDPEGVVRDISDKIRFNLNKNVIVMIIDTDVTYQLFGKKFTSIPIAIPGIKKDLGVIGYVFGRWGEIRGPTPLAVSKLQNVDESINIAKIAEECQKKNDINMETVYDMKNMFNGEINSVTIEMLESIQHTPAIIVRKL